MPVSIIRREIKEHNLPADLHPVLARVFAARSINDVQQLEKSLNFLLPFHALKNIDKASSLLLNTVEKNQRVIIVADFDADGATSCVLLVRALRMLGLTQVEYLVPDRFKFGYGLTPEIVEVAMTSNPQLIITVDNGISSLEGVALAKANGISVLVTDHHLPGNKLPDADVIVNPNQRGDSFLSKNLAGVGVIFYVMLALRSRLREINWFEENAMAEPNFASLLDLVALGTVADVVPLDHNNRILVSQGLARIRQGKCVPGISAILEVAKRNRKNIISSDLGFAVGPRLNAAGRLEDMSLGIECLLTDDPAKAKTIAQQLDKLNVDRRDIEAKMQQEAESLLQTMKLAIDGSIANNDLPFGLCLFEKNWHQGVIGILASRVKEKLHRPVIAFAAVNDFEMKGSARSVPGLHIRDVLDSIATKYPDLLSKFGGHAMAAGMQLAIKDYETFSRVFDEETKIHLCAEDLRGMIQSDGELAADELGMDLAQLIRHAGPWGQAFPEPVFDGEFELVQKRIVGEKHLKLVLKVPGHEKCIDAIAFNTVGSDWPEQVHKVTAVYRLDVNEFRGVVNPQLVVEHIQPV